MIVDKGLPESSEQWPPGVLDALAHWEQGDVVANPPLFYFADPNRPVWAATHAYSDVSDSPEVVEVADAVQPPYGLITTQTCDIAEEGRSKPVRPWVQVAPIYAITDNGWKRKLRKGSGPKYWLLIPDLRVDDQLWAADLRIEVPIEKGWLAGQERTIGFIDEAAKRAVGSRLALLRSRPAFSSLIDRLVVAGFASSLEKAITEDGDLEDHAESVLEICLQVDSFLDPRDVRIVVVTDGEAPPPVRTWLDDSHESIASELATDDVLLHPIGVEDFNTMLAKDYRQMTPIWQRTSLLGP